MIAMDTLKALLASTSGKDCVKLITDPEAVAFLKVQTSTVRSLQKTSLYLTQNEMSKILVAGGTWSKAHDMDWCWTDSLWQTKEQKDCSFDSWICRLVPALLVCCYGHNRRPTDSQARLILRSMPTYELYEFEFCAITCFLPSSWTSY